MNPRRVLPPEKPLSVTQLMKNMCLSVDAMKKYVFSYSNRSRFTELNKEKEKKYLEKNYPNSFYFLGNPKMEIIYNFLFHGINLEQRQQALYSSKEEQSVFLNFLP